jgi:hypothetical protein
MGNDAATVLCAAAPAAGARNRHDGGAGNKEDGGPSIAERIARGSGGKVWFRHADNTRVPARGAMGGWDQVRSRWATATGRPMMVTFASCTDSIRTIPTLQHDPGRPEDVTTDSEDHGGRGLEAHPYPF